MRISIVVPIRWSADRTGTLLEKLLQQNVDAELEVLAVVLDRGHGQNGTGAYPTSWPAAVTVIYAEPSTPAAARNAGSRNTTGDYLAFIDDDCLPGTDWLASLLAGFNNNVGAVVGGLTPARPDSLIEKYLGVYGLALPDTEQLYTAPVPFVSFGHSANLLVRRNVFSDLGGFDAAWRTGEDHDFCYRLLKAGWQLRFLPQAAVAHYHRTSIGAMLRQVWGFGKGQSRLIRRHWPGTSIVFARQQMPRVQARAGAHAATVCRTPFGPVTKFVILALLGILHWGFLLLLFAWWIRLGWQLRRQLQKQHLAVGAIEQLLLPVYHLARDFTQDFARVLSGVSYRVLWL